MLLVDDIQTAFESLSWCHASIYNVLAHTLPILEDVIYEEAR